MKDATTNSVIANGLNEEMQHNCFPQKKIKKITRKGKGENDNNIDRVFAMGFI